MFGDDDIYQDDNASHHKEKTVKTFLEKRHIGSMSWPPNSPDVKPIDNLRWKLQDGALSWTIFFKGDLATVIRESWNRIDEEFCVSLKRV
uniref:Tc1-like transposase DDE domain-containing protein n=1 Tax=Gouania willdenowi TaxID=441366 RepID=A0A8C5GP53_GOUWI